MKKWIAALIIGFISTFAFAGDDYINGCEISVSTTAASTSSDAQCVWANGAKLTMQCDVAVHYAIGGQTATTSHAKVDVGDPYRIQLRGSSRHVSIRTVAGTGTCRFYHDLR